MSESRANLPISSFNEAGAINPGKLPRPDFPPFGRRASMRPGQLTPENGENVKRAATVAFASMRPGQLTPENGRTRSFPESGRWGFNEAGAINPGKRWVRCSSRTTSSCFNEAGAINPGKPRGIELRCRRDHAASMRPGQLTPENRSCMPYRGPRPHGLQ